MMTTISRSKIAVPPTAVCADCSDSDVAWVSLNRGVFLCTECCSIHRSLGRHVSQVRSLKNFANAAIQQTNVGSLFCSPVQLALVQTLHNLGSNNIWEHLLLDPTTLSKYRRKPTVRDPLYPSKADFIRSKYVDLMFALKPDLRTSAEEDSGTFSVDPANDLNKQLYSCVRTNYVETTLRLLAQGADPCGYVDPETGLTPLHVAAKEGQDLQVELLYLYGADPAQPDFCGLLPHDHAKNAGFKELSGRLVDLQFEVTDRLSFYLCGRKPDHGTVVDQQQNFIVPEVADIEFRSAANKSARRRLQSLSDLAFEKLAQDIYDEVDRRETDATWSACLSNDAFMTGDRYVVPFLPVNPSLPSIRNQHRQKLAKFTGRELFAFIIDLLAESKRRCCGSCGPATIGLGSINKSSTCTTASSVPKSLSSSSAHGAAVASTPLEPHASVGSANSSGGLGEVAMSNSYGSSRPRESDGPVYDLVASDNEDLMALMEANQKRDKKTLSTNENHALNEEGDFLDGNFFTKNGVEVEAGSISLEEYLDLKAQLAATEAMVEEMQRQTKISTNQNLSGKFAVAKLSHSETKALQKQSSASDQSQQSRPFAVFRSASLNVIDQQCDTVTPPYSGGDALKFDPSVKISKNGLNDGKDAIFQRRSSVDHIGLHLTATKDATIDYSAMPDKNLATVLISCVESLTSSVQALFADARGGHASALASHVADVRRSVDRARRQMSSAASGGVDGSPPPPSLPSTTLDVEGIRVAFNDVSLAVDQLALTVTMTSSKSTDDVIAKVVQAAYEVAHCAKSLLAFVQ